MQYAIYEGNIDRLRKRQNTSRINAANMVAIFGLKKSVKNFGRSKMRTIRFRSAVLCSLKQKERLSSMDGSL